MRNGIKALEDNPKYWKAFVLSNKAMLIQMLQTKKNKELRSIREKENSGIELKDIIYFSKKKGG